MIQLNIREVLLTVGGLGHLPVIPSTFGSLPPVLLGMVFMVLAVPVWILYLLLVSAALMLSIACLSFGDWDQDRWESNDPQAVVADETIGQTLPLLWLPWHSSGIEERESAVDRISPCDCREYIQSVRRFETPTIAGT
ncbi:phosphatidylglycerophosphatase A family protein [Haladaptatus sp. DFWS20]|uniref:phosphatidylglycerophosphatase A family protein n=1 Tax=Haladaptatus sp. DFWS20 TaxID=3403467 RepID=UPI003EBF4BD0